MSDSEIDSYVSFCIFLVLKHFWLTLLTFWFYL